MSALYDTLRQMIRRELASHRFAEIGTVQAVYPSDPGPYSADVVLRGTELVLRHVWEGGADAVAPERVAALHATLADHMAQRGRELADPNADAVKQQLRANTEEALAAGAFGVPSFVVDDKLFWGLDGLPMLKACLQGDAWFDSPNWDSAASVQVGVRRV